MPDNPGGNGKGPSADQFSDPVVEKGGALDIAFVNEECNTSLDHHLLFQRSTDGGTTFLPKAVRVDGPGEFVDNPNLADLLPNKKFRAPNTESIAYSEATGTLAYVYTNYDNMATQGGNIEVKTSTDQGSTWSTGQVISTSGGAPAPNDQFFPWIAASPNGAFSAIWLDCRRDPNNHDIDTFQATSRSDGATWSNSRISTVSWDPDNGFFKSGSFIGDYSGLAAADNVIYPVWTDGRNNAIAPDRDRGDRHLHQRGDQELTLPRGIEQTKGRPGSGRPFCKGRSKPVAVAGRKREHLGWMLAGSGSSFHGSRRVRRSPLLRARLA